MDNELDTIEDMYRRRHNALDKQFQEISRKHKRELKERELVQELSKYLAVLIFIIL